MESKTTKERPILFTGDMVRAILDGRKTQTRRPIKPQPDAHGIRWGLQGWEDCHGYTVKCPCGEPGDILYVRESYRKYINHDDAVTYLGEEIIEYAADGHGPIYQADGDGCQMFNADGTEKMIPWRPPIHMPKSAARIWLQVTDTMADRVQNISEWAAMEEGVEKYHNTSWYKQYGSDNGWVANAYASFATLWKCVYGEDSWDRNDWVWPVSFRVLSTTGRPAKFPALCEAL